MKIFQCEGCGHIEFIEAPEKCLVCRSSKDAFRENPEAIMKPQDHTSLTEAEKKHLPAVNLSKECAMGTDNCINVNVKVGEIPHVMQEQHYIKYVDYYLNHKYVSRVWLSPDVCHPGATLHLNADSGTVTVVENCNLHGNWMNEVTI